MLGFALGFFAIVFALVAWLCFLIVFFVGAARASDRTAGLPPPIASQEPLNLETLWGRVGIEPTTNGLYVRRSTAELPALLAPLSLPSIVPLAYAEVHAIVSQYDWDVPTMMAIAYRESRFDNTAVNPESGCACWFQVHPMHGYDQALLTRDPLACTMAAYRLWLADGYRPWEATR